MKPNIFFKTPKCGGTSIVQALKEAGFYSESAAAHEIHPSGLCVARFNRAGDEMFNNMVEWEGEFEETAYCWTVVRNPWARLVSCWFDLRHRGAVSTRHSFDQFISFLAFAHGKGGWEKMLNWTPQKHLESVVLHTRDLCDHENAGVPALYPLDPQKAAATCGCFFTVSAHCDPWPESYLFEVQWPDIETGVDVYDVSSTPRHLDKVIKFENFQNDFNEVCDDLGIDRLSLPYTNTRSDLKKGGNSNDDYTTFYTPKTKALVAATYAYEIDTFGYTFGAP